LRGRHAGQCAKDHRGGPAAYQDGARLVLTPELADCGYAAEDLFLRPSFIQACDDAVNQVARELAGLKGLTVVVGTPTHGDNGKGLRTKSVEVQQRHNAARVLHEGRVIETYAKRELPNYQVFDERRYFTPGQGTCVFQAGEGDEAISVGLLICEDAWFEEPARLAGGGRRTAGGHQCLAFPRGQGRRARADDANRAWPPGCR
jgi:NAD+ synthase (glutamine-hydrolysing)